MDLSGRHRLHLLSVGTAYVPARCSVKAVHGPAHWPPACIRHSNHLPRPRSPAPAESGQPIGLHHKFPRISKGTMQIGPNCMKSGENGAKVGGRERLSGQTAFSSTRMAVSEAGRGRTGPESGGPTADRKSTASPRSARRSARRVPLRLDGRSGQPYPRKHGQRDIDDRTKPAARDSRHLRRYFTKGVWQYRARAGSWGRDTGQGTGTWIPLVACREPEAGPYASDERCPKTA